MLAVVNSIESLVIFFFCCVSADWFLVDWDYQYKWDRLRWFDGKLGRELPYTWDVCKCRFHRGLYGGCFDIQLWYK